MRMAEAYRHRWRAWQILSGCRGWCEHPISTQFQMVVPYPPANPCYAMNKMGYMKAVAALGGAAAKASGRAAVAEMKALPTDDDAFGPGRVRADGRGELPAYLWQVKTPEESNGEWDLYRLVSTSPPAEVLHPLNPKCNFPTT